MTWCQAGSKSLFRTNAGLSSNLSQSHALSPGHTVPIWRSRSLRSEKSWTSAWSAHEVVATSYWHLGSLLGRETIGSDREASMTKFYCKTLSCWSWLWLRSIHGSISVVCGIGNVVGLSYPAWRHSWTACGHSWTAYGWSWRSPQYNHNKLSNWCDFCVLICFKMYIYICVYKFIFYELRTTVTC